MTLMELKEIFENCNKPAALILWFSVKSLLNQLKF